MNKKVFLSFIDPMLLVNTLPYFEQEAGVIEEFEYAPIHGTHHLQLEWCRSLGLKGKFTMDRPPFTDGEKVLFVNPINKAAKRFNLVVGHFEHGTEEEEASEEASNN